MEVRYPTEGHHRTANQPIRIRQKSLNNKNAFQWDGYCPLVDRMPACTVGVYWRSTCQGVNLPRACTYLGEYLPKGVYLPGGVPGQVLPPVDRQTHVKTSTSQTLFAGGNNRKRLTDFNKNACACGKYHWLATPVPWLGVRQLSSAGSSVAISLTLMLGINWPQ